MKTLIDPSRLIRTLQPLVLSAVLLLHGCGGAPNDGNNGPADSVQVLETTAELPGLLVAPTGDTVEMAPNTVAVIYYWLPLMMYEDMEQDLLTLASLDSGYAALPVQPDHDTRNHAQRVVNSMEISLPVYLADSAFMRAMDTSILPFCMVILPDGRIMTESGFGSPGRLLGPMLPDQE